MSTSASKGVSISNYFILTSIFKDKGWEKDDSFNDSLYSKFCRLLDGLESKEQSLMIDLTGRFLHISQAKYIDTLVIALKKLFLKNSSVTKYYVFPMTPEKDIGDMSKSTFQILYLFKGSSISNKMNLNGVSFHVVSHPEKFAANIHRLNNNEKILLVDDFIGTGETALDAILYLQKIVPFAPLDKISLLSLVAHNLGIRFFDSESIDIAYAHDIDKGISNYYTGDNLDENIRIMTNIERKIKKLRDKFRFGYSQSEALVCMERIPNNTFPIYWLHEPCLYAR